MHPINKDRTNVVGETVVGYNSSMNLHLSVSFCTLLPQFEIRMLLGLMRTVHISLRNTTHAFNTTYFNGSTLADKRRKLYLRLSWKNPWRGCCWWYHFGPLTSYCPSRQPRGHCFDRSGQGCCWSEQQPPEAPAMLVERRGVEHLGRIQLQKPEFESFLETSWSERREYLSYTRNSS